MAGWTQLRTRFEHLPEWQNPDQMHALYCSYDFHRYDAGRNEEFMLEFWKRAILDINVVTMTIEELRVLADREGRRPLGLENIVVRGR